MRTSETVTKLMPDLIKAQAQLKNVATSEKAEAGKKGTYKYFNLAALRDHTMPILCQHNLTIQQTLDFDEQGNYHAFSRLYHISGEWIEARYPIPIVPDMQIMGSAITYGRRYSWMSLLGLHGDKDDDGALASRGLGDYVTEAFSPKSMDPFAKGAPGDTSNVTRFSAKTPMQLLQSVILTKETLTELHAWWELPATVETRTTRLSPSFKQYLFLDFMHRAFKVATNATELSDFYVRYSNGLEIIRSMDPHEADVLDEKYAEALDRIAPPSTAA